MVMGILAAYPTGKMFDDVMLDLQAIADAPVANGPEDVGVQLSQVHALNCLKDILNDSRFGPGAEHHIANCLDLATQSINSPM